MANRTQKEINELGFKALVAALGRDDALRFIRQFGGRPGDVDAVPDSDETLPSMTPDQAHQAIRDMQEPTDQASLL